MRICNPVKPSAAAIVAANPTQRRRSRCACVGPPDASGFPGAAVPRPPPRNSPRNDTALTPAIANQPRFGSRTAERAAARRCRLEALWGDARSVSANARWFALPSDTEVLHSLTSRYPRGSRREPQIHGKGRTPRVATRPAPGTWHRHDRAVGPTARSYGASSSVISSPMSRCRGPTAFAARRRSVSAPYPVTCTRRLDGSERRRGELGGAWLKAAASSSRRRTVAPAERSERTARARPF